MAQEYTSKFSIGAEWNALYINGEWVDSEGDETIAVEDPSTRETVVHVPSAVASDVDAAYDVAAAARSEWAEAPPVRREQRFRNSCKLSKNIKIRHRIRSEMLPCKFMLQLYSKCERLLETEIT